MAGRRVNPLTAHAVVSTVPVMAPLLLVAALGIGGLGLAPGDPADEPVPVEEPVDGGQDEPPAPDDAPLLPVGLGSALILAALLSRREGPGSALGLRPPGDPIVVFVVGHGQGDGREVFEDLVDSLGLDEDDARFFDYRYAAGWSDPRQASRALRIDPAARSLNSYLGAVGAEGRPMFLVGFSKGGATIAHLIAGWDAGLYGPDGVQGAALLDPPMAVGAQGWAQSVGRFWDAVPDDGGYDPVSCDFLWFGCTDSRDHLGAASGVEVLVVRNPKAGITSFADLPEGLRVYDAPDDGRGLLEQVWHNPLALPARVAEAHEAVLHDPAVARCITAEMWQPGSCGLTQRTPFRYPQWRKPVAARADGGIWPK